MASYLNAAESLSSVDGAVSSKLYLPRPRASVVSVTSSVGVDSRSVASQQPSQHYGRHIHPRSISPGQASSSGSASHWMDVVVQDFLEANPTFAREVSRTGLGRYSICGHAIVDMGHKRRTVSVDGGQRPFTDVLEEFRRIFELEGTAKSGAVARRVLSALLADQEQERLSGCFQSWQQFGQQSANARESLRRRCWTAWVAGVHVRRANERHDLLRARQQRSELLHGLLQLCLSAWHWRIYVARTTFDLARERGIVDATIAQLRYFQGVVPFFCKQSGDILRAAACAICFLRWSREAQSSKRRSSECFLGGHGRVLQEHVEGLDRQMTAKDLFASSFAGPEAQLYKLSHAVDSFVERLDDKDIMPKLTPSVKDAAARNPEFWQSAVDACEKLAVVHRTVTKLQADIEFVLYLRCFSGWVRVAGDTREAHGLRALQMRQDQVSARSRTVTARYDAFFVASDADRVLKKTFASWALRAWLACGHISGAVTSKISACMSKLCRSDSNTHVATSLMETLCCNLPLNSLLTSCCNEHALTSILAKWALLVSTEIGKEVQQMRVSLREARDGRARRRSITQEIGKSRYLRALMVPLRTIFEAWSLHNRDRRFHTRMARRRASIANWRMRFHFDSILCQCFEAFTALLRISATRRILSEHLLFRCFGESFSLLDCCMYAWRMGSCKQQSERMVAERQQREQQLKNHAFLVLGLRSDSDSQATKHYILSHWLDYSKMARRDSTLHSMETERRQIQRGVEVMRRRACAWRNRIDEHVVAVWDAPLCHAAFVQWGSCVLQAKQDRHVANEWIQRQRGQERLCRELAQYQCNKERLLQHVGIVVDSSFTGKLPNLFRGWRLAVRGLSFRRQIICRALVWIRRSQSYVVFKLWSCSIIQGLVRLAAFRYGQALVSSAQINYGLRVLLLWRSLVATRVSWISARRLLALQGIAPLMLRAPRAAFDQLRRNADASGVEDSPDIFADLPAIICPKATVAFLINKESATYLYSAFKIWFFVVEEERQKGWRASSKLDRDALSLKNAVDVAVLEHDHRTNAMQMFARWSNQEENERTLIPKYFAMWLLAHLQEHAEARADVVSWRLADMTVCYRGAAESLLVKAVLHQRRMALMLECWFAFVLTSCVRVQRFRLVKRQCGFVENAGNTLLLFEEEVVLRQCVVAWICYQQRQRRTDFKHKAGEMARRLVNRNHQAFGLLTVVSAWIAWCSMTWQGEHLLPVSLGRHFAWRIPAAKLSRLACRLEYTSFAAWASRVGRSRQAAIILGMVSRSLQQLVQRSAMHTFTAWASRVRLLRHMSRTLQKSNHTKGRFLWTDVWLVFVRWWFIVNSRQYLALLTDVGTPSNIGSTAVGFGLGALDEASSQRTDGSQKTTSPPWSPHEETPSFSLAKSFLAASTASHMDGSSFRGTSFPSTFQEEAREPIGIGRFNPVIAGFSQPRFGASDPRTLGYSEGSGRASFSATRIDLQLSPARRDSDWAAAKEAFGSSSSMRRASDISDVKQRYPWPPPSYLR